MIYNKFNAPDLWPRSESKGKYVMAPKPGRPFVHSVALTSLLKRSYGRDYKKEILAGQISVNDVVVKELKHPVCFLDYLQIKGVKFQVYYTKVGKSYKFTLKSYNFEKEIYPVKKWSIKDGQCLVNTFQNKNVNFEINEPLFEKLRDPYYVVVGTQLVDLRTIGPYSVYKLTGKDKFVQYEMVQITKDSLNYYVKLSNNGIKEVKLNRKDFRKRYTITPKHV